jgi:hypothetical protein
MSPSRIGLGRVAQAWDSFFYQPVDRRAAALFRIGFALLVLINTLGYYDHLEMWFGESGVLPLDVSRAVIDPDTLTVFAWLPPTNAVLWSCYALFNIQIVGLLIGFAARFNAVGVFVWLVSFDHRNVLIYDGEDTVFRIFAFLLIFLPLADTLSVNAYLKSRLGVAQDTSRPKAAWAFRLIQIQTVLIVWCSAVEKLRGQEWIDGTALYYISRSEDLFGRFPLPSAPFEWLPAVVFMTWSVLTVELSLPILIWFKSTRRLALAAAILFHLGLDYSMNLFLFQWIMILGWLTFVTRDDLRALREKLQSLTRGVQSKSSPRLQNGTN